MFRHIAPYALATLLTASAVGGQKKERYLTIKGTVHGESNSDGHYYFSADTNLGFRTFVCYNKYYTAEMEAALTPGDVFKIRIDTTHIGPEHEKARPESRLIPLVQCLDNVTELNGEELAPRGR